jgi:cytochrome P450
MGAFRLGSAMPGRPADYRHPTMERNGNMNEAVKHPIEIAHEPVFEFDMYRDPHLLEDIHKGYAWLKANAPPLFWTPCNGGHWVACSADALIAVLRDPERFSSRFQSIPLTPQQPRLIPESLDPPEHRPFRQLLRPFFESKAIAPLEPRIAEWTNALIDEVIDKGSCEFVSSLAESIPISVFMEIFGLPIERRQEFRKLAADYFGATSDWTERLKLGEKIKAILADLIDLRTREPKDDLLSTLITIDFEGRRLTHDELMSIGFLMFLGGLDTVTIAMTFGMKHLAHDPALRQRIIDDPDCIPAAVDELLRRYTFVATIRHVAQDTELAGCRLRAGEMILAPLPMISWDEKLNPDPFKVNLERATPRNGAFGSGVHTCLGLHLARTELAAFYRIWFSRIGHFHEVDTGTPPVQRPGVTNAQETLQIAWP